MRVMVDLVFKAKDTLVKDRIHHLYFPAILQTSDGSLETKNMQLEFDEIIGMSIDCFSGSMCDASFAVKSYGDKPIV